MNQPDFFSMTENKIVVLNVVCKCWAEEYSQEIDSILLKASDNL